MTWRQLQIWFFTVCSLQLLAQNQPAISKTFLNTPLVDVIEEFENQHRVLFAYNEEEIEGIFVHATFKEASIEQVIEYVLRESGMEYLKVKNSEFLIRRDFSQEAPPYLLTGKLVSADNQKPLAWATIYDAKTEQSSYTDEQGEFKLRLITDETQGNLHISYVGFKDTTVVWKKGQKSFFVEMQTSSVVIREIEVIQRLPSIRQKIKGSSYQRKVSLEKVNLGSRGVSDELSSIRFLPGISATEDLSAGLNVRGGDESENLYLLDGIEFWNVGHFFGVFSAFEPKIIDSTKLHLTDFPVEYGGRTSGVVDMTLKDPEPGIWKGVVDLHSLYSHLHLNIPLTKKSAVIVSTRFTNGDISDTDLFDVLFQNTEVNREVSNPRTNEYILSIVPDFRFNDNQIKWKYQPDNDTRFSISVVGGRDTYLAQYNALEERMVGPFTLRLNHLFQENIQWENGGFNLSYDQDISPYWTSSLDLVGSSQNTRQNLNAALVTLRQNGPDTLKVANNNRNLVAGGGLHWTNHIHTRSGHLLTLGLGAENHRSELQYIQPSLNFLRKDTSINVNLYASHNLPITSSLRLKYGLRASYYQPTDQVYSSPRLALQWDIGEHWRTSVSIGRYNQYLRNLVYEDAFGKLHDIWLLANDTIPVLQSNHYNAFLEYRRNLFHFKVDFFLKQSTAELRQMWIQRGYDPMTGNPRSTNLAIFQGRGETRGIDVYTGFSTPSFAASLAYTYSINTISVDRIDNGTPFPGNNDRRHELNGLIEWFPGKWTVGLATVYGSGLPYVSAIQTDGRDRRNLTVQESITRLNDYVRIDLSANYDFELWKDDWSIGFSIFNVLNRKNTDQIQYLYDLSFLNSSSGEDKNLFGSEIQMLPRTVDIHLTWRFD